jgi:hypothetical protein
MDTKISDFPKAVQEIIKLANYIYGSNLNEIKVKNKQSKDLIFKTAAIVLQNTKKMRDLIFKRSD